MTVDPLEGAGSHDCDGGWKWVSNAYAEHLATQVTIEGDTPPTAVRAALRNSVYPCRDCQPSRFFRWAQGHFSPTHDIGSCPDCIAAHGGPKAARRHAKAAHGHAAAHEPPPLDDRDAPPERKDLD